MPPPPPPPPPLSVTTSDSSFDYVGIAPQRTTLPTVGVGLAGGTGPYFFGASSDDPEFVADVEVRSERVAVVTLVPLVEPTAPLRRSGNVTLQVCSDAPCQHVVWTKTTPRAWPTCAPRA